MAGKRAAGSELTADNWDKEDEPEDRGIFKTASADELKNRVIKKATRRRVNNDGDTQKIGAFASFSGFAKSNSAATTLSASSSSPFSFLSKISSVTSVASTGPGSLLTTTSSNSSMISKDNTDSSSSVVSPKSSNSSNEEYHSKLKGLNLSVLEWIKSHLDKNPLVILSPIFKDYEKHLAEIQKSKAPENSNEKVKILSDFKFDSKPNEPPSAGFSFGVPSAKEGEKKSEESPKSTFSFGCSKPTEESAKSNFTFGTKSPKNETTNSIFAFGGNSVPVSSSKTFTFGSKPEDNKDKAGFSFGASSTDSQKSTFSFGVGAKTTTTSETKPFSFGSAASVTSSSDDKEGSTATKPAFSFGSGLASAPTTGFSFSGSAPSFSFGSVAPPAVSVSSEANKEDEEESDEPPKVEFKQVEESDSVYSKKCKVFVKNEDKFGDRGVGTLHLKPVEGQKKTQLIVRADTNLGNLLLNLLLNESVPTKRMGKKDVLLVGVPMPTDKKPTQILIRVKTEEEADELLETLEKNKKQE